MPPALRKGDAAREPEEWAAFTDDEVFQSRRIPTRSELSKKINELARARAAAVSAWREAYENAEVRPEHRSAVAFTEDVEDFCSQRLGKGAKRMRNV